MMGLMVDGGVGQLVKKLSRSRRIVKSQKTLAPFTLILKASLLIDSSTSTTQIVVKYDGVDGEGAS